MIQEQNKTKTIIVGSGIFGMSTALWQLRDGRYDVTILDKAATLPAPDAASNDFNKIVRAGDYADPAYAKLVLDAVDHWRKPEWKGTYHESGVMMLNGKDFLPGLQFVQSAYTNLRGMGIDVKLLNDTQEVKDQVGQTVPTGLFGGRTGYINPIGGWVEATRATSVGIDMVRELGGKVLPGKEVVGFEEQGRKVNAVLTSHEERFEGDLIVTPALLTSPGMTDLPLPIEATGHAIGAVQLTPDEAATYVNVPVIINFDDSFYILPPTADGIVKFALHSAAHIYPKEIGETGQKVSEPFTALSKGGEGGMIPKDKLAGLKKSLKEIYPESAKRPFCFSRLCWYSDTATGDWLIDYHPSYDNLFLATGDCGHAFKYTPVIGREILKVIQGHPNIDFEQKWKFGYKGEDAGADVKFGERQLLVVNDLCTQADLDAPA